MTDCFGGTKFQSLTMKIAVLLSCLYIYIVWGEEGKIRCSFMAVEQFNDALLECQFPENLNVSKKDFTIYHYTSDKNSESIVDCWWIKGNLDCFIKPGFEYNKAVNTQLAVTIRNVTASVIGNYACQAAGYGPNFLKFCNLQLSEGMNNTCSDIKEESQLNASLTCYFSEHTEKKQENSTVVKDNGQNKETTEDKNESRTVIVAGVVAAAVVAAAAAVVILFLKCRRKCSSSSKKQAEDHEESTPMIKTPIMEKEEEERMKVTEALHEYLEKAVKEMYPDMTGTFYFVPPVYFNRTRYKSKEVAKEVILVPDCSTENDFRHDRAMQHVMHCLRHLAEHREEKMFVLTQFTFDAYLKNVGTNYVRHLLPTADSNNSKSVDLLIIHQKHGVLVGVVKTVSDNDVRGESNQEKVDERIISQIKEGMEQLQETVCTISQLTSNPTPIKVRNVLMMPKLPRSSLLRAIASQPEQFANCSDIEMCLCADDLSDSNAPWNISSDRLDKLVQWWNKVMENISDNHDMTEELYVRLISRFCGPATQPSVQIQDDPFLLPKTLAEAVSVTGDLYNRLTLSQDMVDLLLRERRLLLVGPPNTGKTRLLTLAGKKWIQSGHELHVFYGSAEPCESLMHAFGEHLRPASAIEDDGKYSPSGASIKHLKFDKEKVIDKALKTLIEMKREQNVYVVADDVDVDGKCFRKFCESLKSKCPDVHLWATGSKLKAAMDGWQVKTFTRPPNCPPALVRECPLPEANYYIPDLRSEQTDNLYPTDGPPVKYIYHRKDGIISSHDCKECGKNVAAFLFKHLIKRNEENVPEDDVISESDTTNVTKLRFDRKFSILQDKDLLVLFESGIKQGENFIEGLKESGIRVDTLSAKNDKDIIIEKTGSACAMHVDQLYKYRPRRKIVVYVESYSQPRDPSLTWRAMTSCSSQLIIVRTNPISLPIYPT